TQIPATPWHHTRHWINPTPTTRRTETAAQHSEPRVSDGQVIPAEWYCELEWPVRPLSAESGPAVGPWLVIADDGAGAQISHGLGEDATVTVMSPSALTEHADSAALADALGGVSHVCYAPTAAPAFFDGAPGYTLFNAGRNLSAAMAATASPPKLFILTRNAQPLSEGDRANPAHAALWGLGRTLALEHPEIWGGVIDVDESVPAGLATRYVLTEAHSGDDEDQVVYRAGVRHVPRLRRRTPPSVSTVELGNGVSHLVIGATGKIGPLLIQQLADMGAATIVAVSRDPGSRLDELAETLSAKGANLVTVAADASDETAMTELFHRFGADLPPLGGIYLAAYSGGPVTLCEMTDDDVNVMFRPKLDAVSLLHHLSLQQPVRQFVFFSSISGVLGSRWLAHYAATTTFLDAFAYARRAAGLPATAVNWGLWKSLADNETEQHRRVTLESGLEPMPDEVAIQALGSLAGGDAPARSTVVAADWSRLATAYRTRAPLHIIDDLLPVTDDDSSPTSTSTFREALRGCEPERRHDLLIEHVTEQVAAVMGAQPLDPSAGFFQSGMDSLMSVTLQRSLAESLGEELPMSMVFDYPTIEGLAGYLATILPELIEAAEQHNTDDYDEFSEDELLEHLSERLAGGR
ncbi:beta-ketoacyl reductase, partial [Mycobacterium sp. E2733]|uniref:beta-ketoacyl reductase n=1 Tax=Mycobacterium sp. E2733 TaxID=1834138 RepID=UPI000A604F07